MVKISKGNALKLKDEAVKDGVNKKIAIDLLNHFNRLHSIDWVKTDKEVEELLVRQHMKEIEAIDSKPTYPRDLVKFNPSGASKTVMDLYLKAKGYKEQSIMFPYHKRWVRNSTAVHEAVQRDLLYAEKVLNNPKYTVLKTDDGLPMWESNILKWVELEHKGERFILNGMSDGILRHEPTGKTVGFELKTKTNTIGQTGYYKMKDPADYHVDQTVAYYLLYGIRDYVIFYEGVVKDHWGKGEEAKPDIRSFGVHITDEMVENVLDKWAYVAKCVREDKMPEDTELGYFSGYKHLFNEEGEFIGG